MLKVVGVLKVLCYNLSVFINMTRQEMKENEQEVLEGKKWGRDFS